GSLIIRLDHEAFLVVSHNPSGPHGARDGRKTAAASLISHLWPPLLQGRKYKNVGGSVESPDILNMIKNDYIIPTEMVSTFYSDTRLQLSSHHQPSLDPALRPIIKQQMSSLPNANATNKNRSYTLAGAKNSFRPS